MKTLLIGAYKDGSGWSKAALNTIKAMLDTGLEVVPRPAKLNNYEFEEPEWLQAAESQSDKNCDVVIYYVPPDHIQYSNKFKKNICYFLCETETISDTHWLDRLELMDEVWVPSNFIMLSLLKSGLTKPIRVVPIPCDTSIYLKSYPILPQIKQEKHGDFLFYNICDFNRRKNIDALVKAFHMEFDYNEPVNLCLKISKNQICHAAYDINIKDWCNNIKDGLKKGTCKQEILLPETYLSDEQIYGIHKGCDVFVSSSHGEGWNIPAFDALAFGKTPIVTGWSSHAEFVSKENGWLADFTIENCFGNQDFPGSLYSSKQRWAQVSIGSLRACMREAYENRVLREEKSDNGFDAIERFSYENVGLLIKKVLYGCKEEGSQSNSNS